MTSTGNRTEEFMLWITACEAVNTLPYCLYGEGENGMYSTRRGYMYKNNQCYLSPVYHVWKEGHRIACTLSYNEALSTYKKNLEEESI